MPDQHNKGSQHEEHRRAAELHDQAAHAYFAAAETQTKQEHLTGSERTRQALEHAKAAYSRTEAAHRATSTFHHADIAAQAYALWLGRGCPKGSADEDWFLAAKQLRGRFGEK